VFDLAPVRHLEGFRSSDQFNPVLEKLDITRTPFSIEPKSLIVVSCSPSYGTTIEWLHAGIELLRGSREPSLSQERSKEVIVSDHWQKQHVLHPGTTIVLLVNLP
jgi:hypothetical protein